MNGESTGTVTALPGDILVDAEGIVSVVDEKCELEEAQVMYLVPRDDAGSFASQLSYEIDKLDGRDLAALSTLVDRWSDLKQLRLFRQAAFGRKPAPMSGSMPKIFLDAIEACGMQRHLLGLRHIVFATFRVVKELDLVVMKTPEGTRAMRLSADRKMWEDLIIYQTSRNAVADVMGAFRKAFPTQGTIYDFVCRSWEGEDDEGFYEALGRLHAFWLHPFQHRAPHFEELEEFFEVAMKEHHVSGLDRKALRSAIFWYGPEWYSQFDLR